MRVLFLISQLPYPLDTGAKIRSYNLIKRLHPEHSISLLTFGNKKREQFKIDAIKDFCKEIILVPKFLEFKYIGILLNFFSFFPYSIKKYYSRKMKKIADKLIKRDGFDLIHCDSLQISLNAILMNGNIPKVLTEHNIESEILRRYSQNETNLLKRPFIYFQWRKLANYEFGICKRFNQCITVSYKDKEYLKEKTKLKNISVIPNGVDCEYFLPQGAKSQPFSLVFTGSLDWLPNEDALIYFFSKIYPLLKKEVPQVTIYIIGRNPTRKILAFAKKDKSIQVKGVVDDIRNYIVGSEVFVVPLRIGGGTRLKILEAMAMAKPVVSTTIGAEGLEVESEKNIILADEPEIFARRIGELFKNHELRKTVGNEGRKLVELKYDWNKIAGELSRVWRNINE